MPSTFNKIKTIGSGLYLTIDDGPSQHFKRLIDFLAERSLPAIFFNRGDRMEERPKDVLYGIKKGYLMGNHAYSHQKASSLTFEDICSEILRTDKILDNLYEQSNIKRPGKYFRFPYMDRGMGAALIEPEELEMLSKESRNAYDQLLITGLGHKTGLRYKESPDIALCQIHKKRQLQDFLKEQGYTALPAQGITLPFYDKSEMTRSIDSLCSFSTCDWTLSQRHKGKCGFHSIDDLKSLIDNNLSLRDKNSNHIILAHDQDELYDIVTELIDYLLIQGFEFLDFGFEKH